MIENRPLLTVLTHAVLILGKGGGWTRPAVHWGEVMDGPVSTSVSTPSNSGVPPSVTNNVGRILANNPRIVRN